jgi:hypothetical protein
VPEITPVEAEPDRQAPQAALPTETEAAQTPQERESAAETERALLCRRAIALFQSGMGVAQVSRELNCSGTEVTLLYSQWRKGRLPKGLQPEAQDAPRG